MRPFLWLCVWTALACSTPPVGEPVVYHPPESSADKVALAVSLSGEITAEPDKAELLLSARGMTPDQLDDLMADIAADAEMSDAYVAARGVKASEGPAAPP